MKIAIMTEMLVVLLIGCAMTSQVGGDQARSCDYGYYYLPPTGTCEDCMGICQPATRPPCLTYCNGFSPPSTTVTITTTSNPTPSTETSKFNMPVITLAGLACILIIVVPIGYIIYKRSTPSCQYPKRKPGPPTTTAIQETQDDNGHIVLLAEEDDVGASTCRNTDSADDDDAEAPLTLGTTSPCIVTMDADSV